MRKSLSLGKRSKYGNHKIKTEEGVYDSQLELARHTFLLNRQKEGQICDLKRQVRYLLIPDLYEPKIVHLKTKDKVVANLIERKCEYVADFTYIRNGKLVVEDCKGEESYTTKDGKKKKKRFSSQTQDFRIKKKLMYWVLRIKVQIVSNPTQWEDEKS